MKIGHKELLKIAYQGPLKGLPQFTKALHDPFGNICYWYMADWYLDKLHNFLQNWRNVFAVDSDKSSVGLLGDGGARESGWGKNYPVALTGSRLKLFWRRWWGVYSKLLLTLSVTSKKSPKDNKSSQKMITLEKWNILTHLQKLPKNVGDLGKLIVATGFEKLPKVQ